MEHLWSAEALRLHWVLRPTEQPLLKGLPGPRRLVLGYYTGLTLKPEICRD
jgi:hypothetical protein